MPPKSYRGLVAGRCFSGAFLVVDFLAVVPVFAWAPAAPFRFAAGFRPAVGAAPEATRDPCFARCRVFLGAASAVDDSVKAAIRASISIFIVLGIQRFSRSQQVEISLRLR